MSRDRPAQLLPRTKAGSEAGQPQSPAPRTGAGPGRPRAVMMPASWWDAPPVVGYPLSRGPRSAAAARRLTRDTLRDWGLPSLAEDAELIVGELLANAVTHGAQPGGGHEPGQEDLGLRLRCGTGVVICAVLDPSDAGPVVKAPGGAEPSGRGLRIVDALSDAWGWSPIAGGGKAVWAVLSVPHGRADERWGVPSQGAR